MHAVVCNVPRLDGLAHGVVEGDRVRVMKGSRQVNAFAAGDLCDLLVPCTPRSLPCGAPRRQTGRSVGDGRPIPTASLWATCTMHMVTLAGTDDASCPSPINATLPFPKQAGHQAVRLPCQIGPRAQYCKGCGIVLLHRSIIGKSIMYVSAVPQGSCKRMGCSAPSAGPSRTTRHAPLGTCGEHSPLVLAA